jgi:hypothetical protein
MDWWKWGNASVFYPERSDGTLPSDNIFQALHSVISFDLRLLHSQLICENVHS